MSQEIVMYSADWCGDCRRSKRLLDSLNVAYTLIDVESDAAAAAKEKARQDEIAKVARQKAVNDSLAAAADVARKAEFARIAREKAVSDSLASVREKARQDSIADAGEKAKLAAIAKDARLKMQKDSLDQLRQKQEAEASQLALAAQKEKEAAALKKKNDDIEAQKVLQSKVPVATKKNPNDMSVYKVDFDRDFIPEGIKGDTIREPNRTIIRTVVKSKDIQATYLKVTYSYGGVFFFKNSVSIPENTYNMDMDVYRKQLNKN